MISDLNEFCKLYKIHVPYYQEQNYYFNLLKQSPQYAWLPEKIQQFEIWEEELKKNQSSVTKEKFHALDLLVGKLQESEAYAQIQEIKLNQTLNPSSQGRKDSYGWSCVSLDLSSANYNLFRSYQKNLPPSWEEFCQIHKISQPLIDSKSFRQVVFGNLNPKKTQKLLTKQIFEIRKKIESLLSCEGNLTYFGTDELIYSFHDLSAAKQFASQLNKINIFDFAYQIGCSLKQTIFSLEKFTDHDFGVMHVFDDQHNYQKLYSVPGNQFYFYFKKYILQQEIEERDLYFWQDGRLAKWVI